MPHGLTQRPVRLVPVFAHPGAGSGRSTLRAQGPPRPPLVSSQPARGRSLLEFSAAGATAAATSVGSQRRDTSLRVVMGSSVLLLPTIKLSAVAVATAASNKQLCYSNCRSAAHLCVREDQASGLGQPYLFTEKRSPNEILRRIQCETVTGPPQSNCNNFTPRPCAIGSATYLECNQRRQVLF